MKNHNEIIEQLKNETEKWTKRIEKELEEIKREKEKEEIIKNIEAYVEDSRYFYNKGDLVKAFEAIIWAWALLEINFKRSYST
ncbi:MAG: DUF357 domain-containing protein [Candidatus Aenigmatarchaeota archaeon]